MDTAAAVTGLLGAGTGLGVVLVISGLRRTHPARVSGRWYGLAQRPRQASRRRVAGTAAAAIVAGVVTRWPVGALLAGMAAWWLPALVGPDRDHDRQVARIEAIAAWAESLRDTLAAAAGLEQALLATQTVAPEPIRAQVTALAARIRDGGQLTAALRGFADDLADDLADPAADLVVAALLLAATQHASDLGQLLSGLAATTREHAGMRLRIAASRARVRTGVQIIIAATLTLTTGLLIFSRAFLAPYSSLTGQLMLAAIGACFAAGFWLLRRIARFTQPQRFLTELAALTTPPREAP